MGTIHSSFIRYHHKRRTLRLVTGSIVAVSLALGVTWPAVSGPLTFEFDASFQATTGMWGGGEVQTVEGVTPFFPLLDVSAALNQSPKTTVLFDVPFDGQGARNFGTYGASADMNAAFVLDARATASFSAGQIDVSYPGRFSINYSDLEGKQPGETATISTAFAMAPGAAIASRTADMTVGIDTRTDLITGGTAEYCVVTCESVSLPQINDIDRITRLVEFGVLDLASRVEELAEELDIDESARGSGAIFLSEAAEGRVSSDGLKDVIVLFAQGFVAQGAHAAADYQARGVQALEDYLIDKGVLDPSPPVRPVPSPGDGDHILDGQDILEASSEAVGEFLNGADGETVSNVVASILVNKLAGFRYVDFGTPFLETSGGVGGETQAESYGVAPLQVTGDPNPGAFLLAEGAQDLLGVGWKLTAAIKKPIDAAIPTPVGLPPLHVPPVPIGDNVTLGYTLIDDLESLTLGVFQSFRFADATPMIELDFGSGTPVSIEAGDEYSFVVPDAPFQIIPRFFMEGTVYNQTATTLRLSLDELALLGMTVQASLPPLTIPYTDRQIVTRTETFLREVGGVLNQALCLLNPLRIWQGGTCYEEDTRIVEDVILVPKSLVLPIPEIDFTPGPVVELTDVLSRYWGFPIFQKNWNITNFNDFSGSMIAFSNSNGAGLAVSNRTVVSVSESPAVAIFCLGLVSLSIAARRRRAACRRH